jgi:TolA-binding protein
MFNIFEEIAWPQFIQMSHIVKLPLQEQINQYNQYLYQLSDARINWLNTQNKGLIETNENENFLLQENLDFLLQENGFKITI